MGKWCPRCGAEYIEGWGTCSTCHVELVDSPLAGEGRPVHVDDPGFTDPERSRDEDPFVPIWEGPTVEASRMLQAIERNHIPVDLGEATLSGHSRIEVPRSYVEEARDALENTTQFDRTGLDWAPLVRLALIVVALGLIVLLIV